MSYQYGTILIFLGILFLTCGLTYYFFLFKKQVSKYPNVTYAIISSSHQYEETEEDSEQIYITRIYYALTLDFTLEGKSYQVRRDIGIHKKIGSKDPNLYAVGEKLKICYNPKNPKDIDVKLNNSIKVSSVLSYVLICMGVFGILIGSYLIFGDVSY